MLKISAKLRLYFRSVEYRLLIFAAETEEHKQVLMVQSIKYASFIDWPLGICRGKPEADFRFSKSFLKNLSFNHSNNRNHGYMKPEQSSKGNPARQSFWHQRRPFVEINKKMIWWECILFTSTANNRNGPSTNVWSQFQYSPLTDHYFV